jgi:hypothetical protein
MSFQRRRIFPPMQGQPAADRRRPPVGKEKIMYLLRRRFNLADAGSEGALHDSFAMRAFYED